MCKENVEGPLGDVAIIKLTNTLNMQNKCSVHYIYVYLHMCAYKSHVCEVNHMGLFTM